MSSAGTGPSQNLTNQSLLVNLVNNLDQLTEDREQVLAHGVLFGIKQFYTKLAGFVMAGFLHPRLCPSLPPFDMPSQPSQALRAMIENSKRQVAPIGSLNCPQRTGAV